jgi:hypothetical protein
MSSVHAIDTDPGDWTAPPPGTNLFLLYAQHANRNALYTNGQQTPNAKLGSDVAILRYVRPVDVSGLIVAPQVLLPWARLRTGGVVAGLGNASSTGDLILASPIWFAKADTASRNSFSFAPYLVLPTGDYDKGQTLNIGENRWKAIFQFGGTYQLSKQIDAEGAIDATLFGKNKDFGASGADTLQQKPLYQLQGSLNWHQSPGTLFAVGLSHTLGGVQKVNGHENGPDSIDFCQSLPTSVGVCRSRFEGRQRIQGIQSSERQDAQGILIRWPTTGHRSVRTDGQRLSEHHWRMRGKEPFQLLALRAAGACFFPVIASLGAERPRLGKPYERHRWEVVN